MTDDVIDKAFSTNPTPDSEAKKRALNLALMEFDAVQEALTLEQQAADTQRKKNHSGSKVFWPGFVLWVPTTRTGQIP